MCPPTREGPSASARGELTTVVSAQARRRQERTAPRGLGRRAKPAVIRRSPSRRSPSSSARSGWASPPTSARVGSRGRRSSPRSRSSSAPSATTRTTSAPSATRRSEKPAGTPATSSGVHPERHLARRQGRDAGCLDRRLRGPRQRRGLVRLLVTRAGPRSLAVRFLTRSGVKHWHREEQNRSTTFEPRCNHRRSRRLVVTDIRWIHIRLTASGGRTGRSVTSIFQ